MVYYSSRYSNSRTERGFKPNKITKIMGIYVLVIVATVFMIKMLIYDSSSPPAHSKFARVHPRKLTILLSQPRSGSSWIGSFFDYDPDVFYLYEPLHPQAYQASTVHLTTDKYQEEILRSLCFCQFTDEVAAYGLYDRSTKIANSQAMLSVGPPSPEQLTALCKESRYTVAKVLQLRNFDILRKLSKECEIDVVHLVRDPRASIKSRMDTFKRFMSDEPEVEEFTPELISNASATICAEILTRAEKLDELKHYVSTTTLTYEKVVKSPFITAQELFTSLEIDWVISVAKRVTLSTQGSNSGGGFDTVKDTTRLLGRWRKTADKDFIRAVENSCSAMMSRFGYSRMYPT